jgi:hypothetical protein
VRGRKRDPVPAPARLDPNAIDRWVLPVPGGPRNTTLLASVRKSSWARWAIVWRLTERWKVKSKSSRRLDLGEARRFDAGVRAPQLALVGLFRQHRGEEGFVVPALVARSLGEQLCCLGDAGHPERPGKIGDLGRG